MDEKREVNEVVINSSAFKNSSTSPEFRTLEDFLKGLELFPRLSQLDESLEEVRWHRKTEEEHKAEWKLLDKELLKLSREHHPDRVLSRGGSEQEVIRAEHLQTALNAARTVLKTLVKRFLEDVSVEYKYEFFTKLDISQLGNESFVEDHAHQVLTKISLISEMKQRTVTEDVRSFLCAGQKCIDSYLQDDAERFKKNRHSAFLCLKKYVADYNKLYTENEEVERECRKQEMNNIYPTIGKMKRDCSIQLRHLQILLELWKRPFGEIFSMYCSTLSVDEYLVVPLVCYTNVILTCSVMVKIATEENSVTGWFGRWNTLLPSVKNLFGNTRRNSVSGFTVSQGDTTFLLYQLALCYCGNAQCVSSMKEIFGWQQPTKEEVKREFIETLEIVRVDLKSRFKIDDYIVKKFNKQQLTMKREMFQAAEVKLTKAESDLQKIRKKKEYINKQLDEVIKNNQRSDSTQN